ncbi:GNAT family N-acetyltransferase [Francisella sp. 19S2-4]|uniref:GNAT family N-acetyltransferase n=1 Tax=Francisella sp. 19S2-4 TaxID=3088361 RepID=UPI003FA5CBAF
MKFGVHFLKDCDKQIEIGFTLSPQAQNKGFAKEAITAICEILFNSYNIHRIIAITDVKNTSAIKTLSKLNFRKEAHFIKNIFFKGKWGDEYLFAILKEEFLKTR